jgi:hypothetical protein
MSFTKEQLAFGQGSFVREALNDKAFHELPIRDQARAIGWAVGCPVVEHLTDPANTEPNRGPENMLKRYGEVGFWFGQIVRTANELNPALADQLTMSIARHDDEPVGVHEPESVPSYYAYEIPPTETLVGYTLPRLLIKQFGGNELPQEERLQRAVAGLDVLDDAVQTAGYPEELLAIFAENIANEGELTEEEVLAAVLPTGWYDEHNADHMVVATLDALRLRAPNLRDVYSQLSEEEKAERNIL